MSACPGPGLKVQAGCVSLSSLHTLQSGLHPWLQDSWLGAGLVTAADILARDSRRDTGSTGEQFAAVHSGNIVQHLAAVARMARAGTGTRPEDARRLGQIIARLVSRLVETKNEDTETTEALEDVWCLYLSGTIEVEVETVARILDYCETLFIKECETMIVDALEIDLEVWFEKKILIRIIASSRNLFSKLMKIFSTMFEEIGQNEKLLKVYQKLCRTIHSCSSNPILLFPSQYQALASLLLANIVSKNESFDVLTSQYKSNLDVKLILLQFEDV